MAKSTIDNYNHEHPITIVNCGDILELTPECSSNEHDTFIVLVTEGSGQLTNTFSGVMLWASKYHQERDLNFYKVGAPNSWYKSSFRRFVGSVKLEND